MPIFFIFVFISRGRKGEEGEVQEEGRAEGEGGARGLLVKASCFQIFVLLLLLFPA